MSKYWTINDKNHQGAEYVLKSALDSYAWVRACFNLNPDKEASKQKMLENDDLMAYVYIVKRLFFGRDSSMDILLREENFDPDLLKFLGSEEVCDAENKQWKALSHYHDCLYREVSSGP
jgi:hypothetical protein